MSFEVFLKTSYYLSSYSSQKKSEGLYGQGAGRLVAWLPVSHFPKICAVGLSAVDCRAVDMYEDVSTYSIALSSVGSLGRRFTSDKKQCLQSVTDLAASVKAFRTFRSYKLRSYYCTYGAIELLYLRSHRRRIRTPYKYCRFAV